MKHVIAALFAGSLALSSMSALAADTATDQMKSDEAKAESKLSVKAKKSLAAAVAEALAANPGYTAVEVTPVLEGKHLVAEITLMKGGQFKGVSEPIG